MSDAEEEAPVVVSVIANPLADTKLTKKLLKVVKKGAAASSNTVTVPAGVLLRSLLTNAALMPRPAAAKAKAVRRGVKEVVKALRKKPEGCAQPAPSRSPLTLPGAASACWRATSRPST